MSSGWGNRSEKASRSPSWKASRPCADRACANLILIGRVENEHRRFEHPGTSSIPE
jgi:hypothetical protein